MRDFEARELRAALEPFARRSGAAAASLLAANVLIYAALVAGTVAAPWLALRLLFVVLAGIAISGLFVIGHDAAHGAYAESRRWNAAIGRVAFLPSLHNFSLWQVQHNRLHHRLANVKGFNSWSPLTKTEFDCLPAWRRAVERLYRSPLGFAPYYLVERWWRDKFFPRRRGAGGASSAAWLDFALLLAFLAALLALLAGFGWSAILWGFAAPFLVWNALVGATIYMHHTHPRVPWFEAIAEWRALAGDAAVTVHVQMPRWYGIASHNIMDHPAHHVHPKIPLYRLRAAQRHLNALLGERAIIQPFSLGYLWTTLRGCKLYDFGAHRWLDFAGRPTSACTLPAPRPARNAAVA